MKNGYSASTLMIFDLKITDDLIEDKQCVQKYQELVDSQQFLIIYTRLDIAFATSFLKCYNNASTQQCWQPVLHLLQYVHELSIILKDFVFLLLIDNTGMIVISGGEKVTRNARHIDICYHHIQDLIEKKIIEISHISTDEMTVNDLTKMLLSNKFKEFIELIRISRIEIDSKISNDETSNSKSNNSKTSDNNKNDGNFMVNYYKEAGEAGKETEEV